MFRLLADENFNLRIVRGLLRRAATLDILSVQEAGLRGADDETVLQWAADQDRILLTHDVETMTRYAYDRVRCGKPMPGVIEVRAEASIGRIIEDLLVLVESSEPEEWRSRVFHVPF